MPILPTPPRAKGRIWPPELVMMCLRSPVASRVKGRDGHGSSRRGHETARVVDGAGAGGALLALPALATNVAPCRSPDLRRLAMRLWPGWLAIDVVTVSASSFGAAESRH